LIRGAKRQLVISGWPRELILLAAELWRADERRVRIAIFSHAELPRLPGEVFTYGLAEASLEEFWKHRLIVVVDDIRTLLAAAEHRDDDLAVVTETSAIAEVATSQVALDITLLSQRQGRDVSQVMARVLGARVGRLDTLLEAKSKATP
jgi:hypothetical protein